MMASIKPPTQRGLFIVLEGCDRSGKTTQSQLLKDRLSQIPDMIVEAKRFPDRTTATGHIINNYLQSAQQVEDHAIHLLFSANRWEAMSALESALQQGRTVVCDRYAYSGAAFTAAKGLDVEWCKQCDKGLWQPDVVLYLDVNPVEMAQRGEYGQERYESVTFQQQVRKYYKALQDPTWKVIDAAGSVDQVHQAIWDALVPLLSQPLTPLRKLWTMTNQWAQTLMSDWDPVGVLLTEWE